jgi:ubiquinone/menaquinone biosynthesis C-methylase UbiE/pimeloyl-ACP methyl ester carboxylesterase
MNASRRPPPEGSRDQRKHVRIRHDGSVTLHTEGRTFLGRTVNISRSGMQVVVHMPESYREIRSLTFHLPFASEPLHFPCRLVRVEKGDRSGEELVLGVEIDYQTEAQMLLIDAFIREMKESRLLAGERAEESRLLPRSRCRITGVSIDRPETRVLSIDNISTDGLLLRFTGVLKAEDEVRLEFALPEDARRLALHGRVMYIIENDFQGTSAAGIALRGLSDVVRTRIANFIVAMATSSAMRSLHERFSERSSARTLDHEYRISGRGRIGALFQVLRARSLFVNALFEGSLQIVELQVQGCDQKAGTWAVSWPQPPAPSEPDRLNAGYFSFYLNGGSHYFKSERVAATGGCLVLRLPSVLYRSEKRSHRRKSMGDAEAVSLSFDPGGSSGLQLQGRLLDISRHGFLCEVRLDPGSPEDSPLAEGLQHRLRSGQLLRYSLRESLGLSHQGEIRHLSQAEAEDGSHVLRIGVEAGVEREPYRFRRIPPARWSRRRLYRRPAPPSFRRPIPCEVVRYRDRRGQEVCALLNRTRPALPAAPVVILPPAFGKKKEALAPLAATLIANFRQRGQDLVVLRYDGINRPGESANDEAAPRRGYEMLHYRISQGLDDLAATLDYVYDNPFFRPGQVILVSSSMSAIDSRRLLAEGDRRIHYWISLMGVSSAQSTLSNTLGGMDIIGNARMGIPNGSGGLLGHLIDMDTLARDLIAHRYAYLTDARQDMARIALPVLWIYGTHDRWVVPREIGDIMSIRSDGEREVLEVPTGHNLRASEDALRTFVLITASIYARLHGRRIVPAEPDREQLLEMITWERERLTAPRAVRPEEYWKTYLLGDERGSLGYDFYRNLKDFRDFLGREAELIRPEEGGRIADMGCGTGLLVERLLERLADRGTPDRPVHLTAVDLVPEALERTREKWERAVRFCPALSVHRLECIRMDLEPNRLIPVQRFLEEPRLGYSWLRNRVEGLTAAALERMTCDGSADLACLMRGEPIGAEALRRLEEAFSPEDWQAILDFNRAARFLRRSLASWDLATPGGFDRVRPLEAERYASLKTSDLRFERLSFGSCGLDLRLAFPDHEFDKIIASLFISYLHNPDDIFGEFYRVLKPGGTLLASSMKPDSDISAIFTSYVEKVQSFDLADTGIDNRDRNLSAARAMLNEAAALFELEEDGYFRFYAAEELTEMAASAGFTRPEVCVSLGNPPQAFIVTARKPPE